MACTLPRMQTACKGICVGIRWNVHNWIRDLTTGGLTSLKQFTRGPRQLSAAIGYATIQVDGGHIPIQEKDKRSFEALAAIVYRPEHLQAVDQHHRQIMENTCVISAMDDNLHTTAIPDEPPSLVITVFAELAFRKHRCENTPDLNDVMFS